MLATDYLLLSKHYAALQNYIRIGRKFTRADDGFCLQGLRFEVFVRDKVDTLFFDFGELLEPAQDFLVKRFRGEVLHF